MGIADFVRSSRPRPSLRDSIRENLSQKYQQSTYDYDLGPSAADLVIEQGDAVAIVDVKTGDPELSLPSSTSPRMRVLKDLAEKKFIGKTIIPVVVTNYRVGDSEKEQLAIDGVKLVALSGSAKEFPLEFGKQVGLAEE